MKLLTKVVIILFTINFQVHANDEVINLGTYKETTIKVTDVHDPHMIVFSAGPSFPDENAQFEESWPYDVKLVDSQTWNIGYSTNIGPYVRWVEGKKIARLKNPGPHPLDILRENGKGCAGTTHEMVHCKEEILDLWGKEYTRVKNKFLISSRVELVEALEKYSRLYKDYLREAAMTASGSNYRNEWLSRQILFVQSQIQLLLSVEDLRE